MSLERLCPFCGLAVDPVHPRTWTKTEAWSRSAGIRSSGAHGGSDVALRKRVDEFAHDPCIRLAQRGIVPTQESLL